MGRDSEGPEAKTASVGARQTWVMPEIESFDAVAVTENTSTNLGDFLNSAS